MNVPVSSYVTAPHWINIPEPSEGTYRRHSEGPVGSRRMASSGNQARKMQNSLGKQGLHAVSCGDGRWKRGLCSVAPTVALLVSAGGRYEA